MAAGFSVLFGVWEKFSSYLWGSSSSAPANGSAGNQNQTESSETSNEHDIPVTKPPETLVKNVQERSSPAQSTGNSHSDHPQIPSHQGFDETSKVDKINLNVKSAGKSMEVEIFPLERVSVLLKQTCELARKKPEKMCLVYDGTRLDVNKTVSQYGLRRGTTVHLIHG